VSERIARFSCRLMPEHVGPELQRQVGRALIDTVGVALAGRGEAVSRSVWRYGVSTSGAQAARIGAGPWGSRERWPAEVAALYNGVAGHVLDFDDVTSPLRGHPSIALLPPLVALAQERDLPGSRLASAYVVGFEVMVRLARAMVHDHYAKGWHATTTLGTVGSAVACCHLLGLSEAQTVSAIGLAVAQAAGTRGNFGTMAKSYQAGHCGASAVRAALLAELGVDGAPDALDGPQGFACLYGASEDLGPALEGLEFVGDTHGAAFELAVSGLEVKKYPMCYAAHRAIDGMLDLRAEHGFRADAVRGIHVTANRRAFVPLIHDRPRTGLEGKFSMQYAMAAALLDGHVRLSSFTDEQVQRPEAQELLRRVSCAEDAGAETPRWNVLELRLVSGAVLRKEVRELRGSSTSPLSDAELRDKWQDCLAFAGTSDWGEAFFDAALRINQGRVHELMELLPAPA
jgi:2-methylcitrate dehydratase PrpD